MSLTMARKPVQVTHFLEFGMAWKKRTGGQSLLLVVVEVLLRTVEWLVGHELARDYDLKVGVQPAQAWLLRYSG